MATVDAIAGCLVGTAVGDALGLPYEGLAPRRARRLFPDIDDYHFLFRRGMFSDDTEHACMTAQSLLVSGGDPRRFVNSLAWRLRWWFAGLPAGIGLATLKACVKLWLGTSPQQSGVHSAGNGPCMRANILGVVLGNDAAQLVEFNRRSTRITHTDPRAEQASLLLATAAACAVEPRDGPLNQHAVFARLRATLPVEATDFRSLLNDVEASLNRNEPTETYAATLNSGKGVSGYVLHTVPAVLHAWLRFPDDYPSAVRSMLRSGGDCDTTAALVGGLVGARVGIEGIPERWRRGLAEWPRNIPWIEKLSRQLAQGIAVPRRSVRVNPIGLIARNILFTLTVFAHIARRPFPPY